jgi:hypothetical protein
MRTSNTISDLAHGCLEVDNHFTVGHTAFLVALVGTTTTQTLTNKTLTSPVLDTGVSGTAVKDEDERFLYATHLATHTKLVRCFMQTCDVITSINGGLDMATGRQLQIHIAFIGGRSAR